MKLLVLQITLVIFTLSGCSDKKKSTPPLTTLQDSLKVRIKEAPAAEKQKSEIQYPLITQENVVDFLIEYGKNNPETGVRISTTYGEIDIQLFEDTPLHRANFIYLVKQKYFDDTFFHRVVPNFIIQGGNSDNVNTSKKRNKIGPNYLLPAELSNGRKHTYGTVSGAKEYRENPDKQTAPFEFFIFLGPDKHTGHLNGNYTIFGKVLKGMDVVEEIANLPSDEGDWPLLNVFIKAVVIG